MIATENAVVMLDRDVDEVTIKHYFMYNIRHTIVPPDFVAALKLFGFDSGLIGRHVSAPRANDDSCDVTGFHNVTDQMITATVAAVNNFLPSERPNGDYSDSMKEQICERPCANNPHTTGCDRLRLLERAIRHSTAAIHPRA